MSHVLRQGYHELTRYGWLPKVVVVDGDFNADATEHMVFVKNLTNESPFVCNYHATVWSWPDHVG